jgi:hypothetical protein
MPNAASLASADELLRAFVVRKPELKLIVDRLRERDEGPNQHILVLGPHGSGKTMLLMRVVEAIRRSRVLRSAWYPIVVGEDSYGIGSVAELWLEVLRRAAEQTGEPRWRQAHRALQCEPDEARLSVQALARLGELADQRGARLLLVIENLRALLEDQLAIDDGWTLRHTLQNESRIMVLASADRAFDAVVRADRPLYELFRIERLAALDRDECRSLWANVTGARLQGKRIRPVQIVTGGNPRLVARLGAVAAAPNEGVGWTDLVKLIDDQMAVFLLALERLPAAERKIYLALADFWRPATASEVASEARFGVNQASALLGRLRARGLVAVLGGPGFSGRAGPQPRPGRNRRYQLVQRSFNLCHLLRRGGDHAQRVRWLLETMAAVYQTSRRASPLRARILALLSSAERGRAAHALARASASQDRLRPVVGALERSLGREPALACEEDEVARDLFDGLRVP